jgi:uncharacterized protein YabN with tetrapyrrole methylase and pyrophosphatase domain
VNDDGCSLGVAIDAGARAAAAGFDWARAEDVIGKVREEADEVEGALRIGDRSLVAAEIGDLLFSACNLARLAGVDPDWALRDSVRRFEARVGEMVRLADGVPFTAMDHAAKDRLFDAAKAALRTRGATR